MAVFRVKKTENYTVMSNYHLRDLNLSYKARGILSTILSLPDTWDYTLMGLAKISKDGISSVRAGVIELENAGYITRSQSRDEKGMYTKNIYNVFEIPISTKKVTDRTDKPVPSCDFPPTDSTPSENPTTENYTQLNTNRLSTYNLDINKSINPSHANINKDMIDKKNNPSPEALITYNKYKALIKENISYDDLIQIKSSHELSIIDEIIEIMTEIVTFNEHPIKISGYNIPAALIKKKFLEISYEDIEYILFAFSRHTGKINNIKSYLIAAIYNAKTTRNNYYDAEVKHDLYG